MGQIHFKDLFGLAGAFAEAVRVELFKELRNSTLFQSCLKNLELVDMSISMASFGARSSFQIPPHKKKKSRIFVIQCITFIGFYFLD